MFELDSQEATAELLRAGGWTLLMAVNLMLFSLIHNPCSTTIYTIWKETRSAKWTTVAALLPVGMGLVGRGVRFEEDFRNLRARGVGHGIPYRQRSAGLQQRFEALTFDIFHDDVIQSVVASYVVNRDNVGVIQTGGSARLLLEAG